MQNGLRRRLVSQAHVRGRFTGKFFPTFLQPLGLHRFGGVVSVNRSFVSRAALITALRAISAMPDYRLMSCHPQRFQHPLRDPPTISVRFAEPPSVVGIGGGQIVEEWLGDGAIVIGACGEGLDISPGSSKGA
jgi:hypothetical protein